MTLPLLTPLHRVLALLFAATLSATTASAISAKQAADQFDASKQLDLSGDKVRFRFPGGVDARIVASTFEQVIALDGKIRRPLSGMTSKVTIELSDGGEATHQVMAALTVPARTKAVPGANSKPAVVPSLQEWAGTKGSFTPNGKSRIVIRKGDADKGKPTLRQRM